MLAHLPFFGSEDLKHRHPYCDAPFTSEIDPHQVTTAFGSRSIPKYAEVLRFSELSEESRVVALQDVFELLSSQESKAIAIQQDLVRICTSLTEQKNEAIQANAALVLSSLVLDYEGRKKAIETDSLSNLCAILSSNNLFVVEASTKALRNMSTFRDGADMLLSNLVTVETASKMIPVYGKQLKPSSIDEKEKILSVIENILVILSNVTNSTTGAKEAASNQAVINILELLKRPLRYTSIILLYSVVNLWNFASVEEGKDQAIEAQAVEIIVRVLTAILENNIPSSADVRKQIVRACTGALMSFTTSKEAKIRAITAEGSVEALTACLYSQDKCTKHNAITAMNNACEAPTGFMLFSAHFLHEPKLIVEVFGLKIVPALNVYLMDKDIQKVEYATIGIRLLSNDPEGVKAIVQCLDMLNRLSLQLVGGGVPAVWDNVLSILKTVKNDSKGNQERVKKALKGKEISKMVWNTIFEGDCDPPFSGAEEKEELRGPHGSMDIS